MRNTTKSTRAKSSTSPEPIRPLRTDADLDAALLEIERLWDAPHGSIEGDRLEVLSILVEEFERRRFPFSPPRPIEAIRFRMEQAGLTPKDLASIFGSRTRVYEVLRGDRRLTLGMIRDLHQKLGIPAEVLLQGRDASDTKMPVHKKKRSAKA